MPTADEPEELLRELSAACDRLQAADKRLRKLRNRGQAADPEVAGCKAALALVRGLIRDRGGRPTDRGGRAERRKS